MIISSKHNILNLKYREETDTVQALEQLTKKSKLTQMIKINLNSIFGLCLN